MFKYYLHMAWKSLVATPVVTSLMLLAIAFGIATCMSTLTIHHMMSMDPIPEKSQQLFTPQLKSYDNTVSTFGMKDGFSEQVTYQDAINLRHSNLPFRQTAMLKTGFAVQSDNADVAPKLQSARAADSDFFAMFNAPFAYGNA